MDEYGDVTPADLQKLQESLERELTKFSDMFIELTNRTYSIRTYDARVVGYAEGVDEDIHGPGAVLIDCPELKFGKETGIYARPRNRAQEGVFEYPSLDSWISIYQDTYTEIYYILGYTFPVRKGYKSGEEIGYSGETKLPLPYKAGTAFDKVRKNPGKFRLLQSSKNIEFSEDRDDKEVTLRVNKDWKINVLAENGGIINVGSSGVGDSVDVNIKVGDTGTVNVKAASTEIKVETKKVSVTSTDIDLIGDVKVDGKLEVTKAVTLKDKLEVSKAATLKDKLDVTGNISGEKEVTANSKGAKVTLTKHTHPTAVPGPAAPATPGA